MPWQVFERSAPICPYRGTRRCERGKPLTQSTEQFTELFVPALDRGLSPDPGAVRANWQEAVAAPIWEGPPLWLHSDLHPAKVLTDGGALRAA